MEFNTLPVDEEASLETPNVAGEVQPTPGFDYAKLIADIAAQVLKIERSSLEPYVEICRIIGFNEAANEVGVGKAMSPYTRLAVGGIILGAGIFLAWRRHGYSFDRDIRKRKELPVSSDVGGGPKPSESTDWTDRRSQFEALLAETMAMDRIGSSASAGAAGSQGSGGSGSQATNTPGGDLESRTLNPSNSGSGGWGSSD